MSSDLISLFSTLTALCLFFVNLVPMLPLTGKECKKYLGDLQARKSSQGYVASDTTDVVQRKIKRKEAYGKVDVDGRGATLEIDASGAVGDETLVPQIGSPHPKKMKTWKGVEMGRARTNVKHGVKDADACSTVLSTHVKDSFWHSEFYFRRYTF